MPTILPSYKELLIENERLKKELITLHRESKLLKADLFEKKSKVHVLEEKLYIYKKLVTNSPFHLVYQDLDLRYKIVVNPQLGLTESDMIGKDEYAILPIEEAEELTRIKTQVIASGEPYKFDMSLKDNNGLDNYFIGSFLPMFDTDNNIIGVCGHCCNITNEVRLKEQLNRFYNLIPDIIVVGNTEGYFLRINNAVENILGYSTEEMCAVPYSNFIHPEDVASTTIEVEKQLNKQSTQGFINRYRCKNGEYKWLEWSALPSPDGKFLYATGRDITKRRASEKELLVAKEKAEQSDRLKSEFINNMSHEIRTPMNGIIGFSNLLGKESLSADRRDYYVSIIQNSSRQLLRVIDDILEISRLGTKQVELDNSKICLNDLLLQMFSIFDVKAKENNTPLYLNKGVNDEESIIWSDEFKLVKILSNLIENALKFTSEGFIEFGSYISGSSLHIYVKDTGVGISEDKLDMIFERFSQEKNQLSSQVCGLGLGLSIAKENTEIMGGTIDVESEKGVGSTFTVTIPYNRVSSTNVSLDVKTSSILIVEDEEVNSLYLETLIDLSAYTGVSVIHAKNGQEAVELCNKQTFDLVFMDLKMPVMDGFEATTFIKESFPHLPIVAQTSYTGEEDKQKALACGCEEFITKPIEEHRIVDILDRYLHN